MGARSWIGWLGSAIRLKKLPAPAYAGSRHEQTMKTRSAAHSPRQYQRRASRVGLLAHRGNVLELGDELIGCPDNLDLQ